LAHLQGVEIEQFYWAVASGGEDEVSSIMELEFPDRACMDVLESMSNGRVYEVPHLDWFVSSTCSQVRTCWVEVNSWDPVFVSFTGHYVFGVVEIPDLPAAVITRSGNNLFLSVQAHASNSLWVGIQLLWARHALIKVIKLLSQVGIGSCIFWPRSVLPLHLHVRICSSSLALLLHARLNVPLNLLLVRLDSRLDLSHSLRSLVLLQLKQCLLLHSLKMLLFDFFNFVFVILM